MKRDIVALIEKSNFNNFIFKAGQINPIKHLRDASMSVPNIDGLYFVFINPRSQIAIDEHLNFNFNNQKLTLVYFGIAGGVAKSGKAGDQKLRGRINNVVGTPSIKRAKCWDNFMTGNSIEEFQIYYCPLTQPQNFEKSCYQYLDLNKLQYPVLNKRRGRPIKKHNIDL